MLICEKNVGWSLMCKCWLPGSGELCLVCVSLSYALACLRLCLVLSGMGQTTTDSSFLTKYQLLLLALVHVMSLD